MITLVQKAVSYFVGGGDDKSSKWEETDRPRLDEFISMSRSAVETCKFEGVITSVRDSDIIINNDVYCDASKFPPGEKICVNNQVTGVAERTTKHEAWQAVHVQMLQERWDDDDEVKLDSCTNYSKVKGLDNVFPGKYTNTSLDPETGIPRSLKRDMLYSVERSKSEQSSETRSNITDLREKVIGRVTGVCAATVSLNDNISFCVSETNCNWEIIEGDWIICEVDNSSTAHAGDEAELEGIVRVLSCKPLRRKKVRGEVTHCYPTFCIINQEIYCSRAVAAAASVKEGDTLMVEAIESHQRNFCWRALEVNSDFMSAGTQELRTSMIARHLLDFPKSGLSVRERKTKNILENKHNIFITQSLRFPTVALGSQSYIGAFIKNNGPDSKTLKRIYFVTTTQECLFNVVSCSAGGLVDGTPVMIDQDMGVNIRFECNGKLLGMVKQLCIFDFADFQIGRYVSANVEDHNMMCLAPVAPYVPNQRLRNASHFQSKDKDIIRGEKPFKSAAFLPVSLPTAHIPKQLWQAIWNDVDIFSVAPSLSEPLMAENHKEKLSALLHLEEIEMTLQIRQFDMARTSFSVHGEYLGLVVPGLAEKRPSLMIGDTVIASSPCDSNELEYEGYIHEVLHTQVLLKFHPAFHNDYCGEDYSVRFNFNRTPLRRCHFALDFAMKQLGPDILFPSKLKLQLPQVCYIDPEASTLANTARKAPDITSVVNSNPRTRFSQSENIKIGIDTEVPVKQRSKTVRFPNEYITENKDFTSKLPIELKCNTSTNKMGVEIKNLENEANIKLTCKGGKEFDDNSKTLAEEKIYHEIGSDDLRMAVQSQKQYSSPVTPRIPVVTRLFGVNSSGSSSNSSMCCSDDESRNSTGVGLEKDAFYAKKFKKEKLNFGSISVTKDIESGSKSGPRSETCLNNVNTNTPEKAACSSVEITDFSTGERSSVLKTDPLSKCCEKEKLVVHKVNEVKRIPLRPEGRNRPLFLPRSLELNFYKHFNRTKEGRDCGENWTPTPTQDHELREAVHRRASETGACREDNGHYETGADWFDSERSKTGAGRVDNGCYETGTGRVDSECCETTVGHVNSARYRNDALFQEPLPNNFTKIKSNKTCQGKQNHKQNTKSKSFSNEYQKCPTNCKPSEAKNGYIVPVLPILTRRKKGTKSLAHLPVLKWFNESLNLEQKLAVRRVLDGSTRPLPYVIFGPPGTGKTVTLVETALQIFTMMQHSRLLIITPSNSASDLVMERLLTFGQLGKMDLVRLNAYQRLEDTVPEIIRPYCCNGDQLSVRVHQRIIVTTATTAGIMYTLGLHNGHFSHVLVDEAGQLTEPECLVALGLVNCTSGQLVLCGDPEQLGPVVQSSLAKRHGLQYSLLQRLCYSVLYQPQEASKSSAWAYQPCLVTQLMKNYRSHPDILSVPSSLFYRSSLQACADNKVNEQLLAWDELPCPSCPLLFHGVVGDNLQEGDSPSWFNAAEAFQVVRYTKSLVMFGVEPQDIGIITPYRKQVEKIRKLLTTFGITENVKVGSVEEFQGQERRVIIISTVRSSTDLIQVDARYSLGFVKCPKRFNVAVTRAQGMLVVVGNPLLLVLDNCWCELIKFCLQKGAYRGPELDLHVGDDQV